MQKLSPPSRSRSSAPAPALHPGSIARQAAARRQAQSLLGLDHSVRSLALRLGADALQAEDLVLEARSVFSVTNSIPLARAPDGNFIPGPSGFPLTPEAWLRDRLTGI